jgi:hypothetical protein
VQEGCLTLAIQSDGLTWSGEAASVEGMLLEAPVRPAEAAMVPRFSPSASDPLLEVQGTSLERLLAGLLARELIRQPLAERYGFGREQFVLLRQTPYRLVLRPLAQGPFQASVELTVLVGGKEQQWKQVLTRLGGNLEKEGLRFVSSPPTPEGSKASTGSPAAAGSAAAPSAQTPPGTPTPKAPSTGPGAPTSSGAPQPGQLQPGQLQPGQLQPSERSLSRGPALTPWPIALWTRQDGVVVGGWQLRKMGGANDQITFFLGPKAATPAPLLVSNLPQRGGMRLMVRPQELALRGLLPEELPEVVKRSAWLWVSSEPWPGFQRDAPLSQLQGSLLLRP